MQNEYVVTIRSDLYIVLANVEILADDTIFCYVDMAWLVTDSGETEVMSEKMLQEIESVLFSQFLSDDALTLSEWESNQYKEHHS